jgi:hypothetical protein
VASSPTGAKVTVTTEALAGSPPGCQVIRNDRAGCQSSTVPQTATSPEGAVAVEPAPCTLNDATGHHVPMRSVNTSKAASGDAGTTI